MAHPDGSAEWPFFCLYVKLLPWRRKVLAEVAETLLYQLIFSGGWPPDPEPIKEETTEESKNTFALSGPLNRFLSLF